MSTSNQKLYILIKREHQQAKKNHKIIYNKIIYKKYKSTIDKYTEFLPNNSSYQERIYCYINKLTEVPKCHQCKNNPVSFHNFTQGYNKYCERKCGVINKNTLSIDQQKNDFKLAHTHERYTPIWETYIDAITPMKFICSIHGEFWQTPSNHKQGKGCYECGRLTTLKSIQINVDELVKRINKLNMDEKYIPILSTYKNISSKMKFICPVHGEFWQTAYLFLNGHYCPFCGVIRQGKKRAIPIEQIKIDFNVAHPNNFFTYDWSTYKNSTTKMKIYCPICENYFWQTPTKHKNGYGCCICKTSNAELKIEFYFKQNKIEYEKQKTFKDCKYIKHLKFDFYLPKHNILIEYDGQQHYEFVEYFHKTHDKFEEQQLKDKIKNNYCYVNKIKLIRIPYWDEKNIENILININYPIH